MSEKIPEQTDALRNKVHEGLISIEALVETLKERPDAGLITTTQGTLQSYREMLAGSLTDEEETRISALELGLKEAQAKLPAA